MKALEKLRSALPASWTGSPKREIPVRAGSHDVAMPDAPFGELDRFLDRFLADPWSVTPSVGRWAAPWDFSEDEEGFTLEVELPGYETGDLDVSVSRQLVSIHGEHREGEDRSWWRRRSDSGVRSVRRVALELPVPADVDHENASARLRNGLLRIRLPKAEEARSRVRRIPVAA